jgi:response regulator RpfG family c-di-GMP phosphodiesterase
MTDTILFVDDDVNLLAGLKRRLRKEFNLEVAEGSAAGLNAIAREGPFAVIVADMRMPGMDGVQFLLEVKERHPNTVRMMLTGNADLQTAIEAVNQGNIFRFLTKPCPMETMAAALFAGLQQYRLIMAEKELLEKTLRGSIKVLTDILSIVNPIAFSRAARIRQYVRHMTIRLQLPQPWQYEIAALLSQIGCVTLPTDTLEKVYAMAPLSAEEQKMFADHPTVAHNLLGNIPRLEHISQMIARQQHSIKEFPPLTEMSGDDRTVLWGAQILKVALDFDRLVASGVAPKIALSRLKQLKDTYLPELLMAMETLQVSQADAVARMVMIRDLSTQMIADQDIIAHNGLLLVPKGQEITYPVMERLRNFSRRIGIMEPVRVIVRQGSAEA